MLKTLSRNNILTGLVWEISGAESQDIGYNRWMSNIRRSHRVYVYSLKDTDGTSELTGYSSKTTPGCESFAVHLRNLYGDGAYYFSTGNNEVYLLMVMDGVIISGSDCVVTEAFFEKFSQSLPDSRYSRLQLIEVTPGQIDVVVESCKASQLVYRKKQRLFWTMVGGGIFILLLASAIFLYSIIAG